MKNNRKGFTLAEVLITLTIVGMIASLTIPSLVNNINNTTNVVQLKKTFSDLQQAFMLLQADNGGSIVPVFQNDVLSSSGGGANTMNAFLTKLNYVKNCGKSMGCWYNGPLYYLNGATNMSAVDTNWNNYYGKSILANGTMVMTYVNSLNCTNSSGSGPLSNSVCGFIDIDANGATGPNKYGRDVFQFWVTQTGIYPIGSFNDGLTCNVSTGNYNDSVGCAYKVLAEGAMNY